MKPSDVKIMMKHCFEAEVVPFLWSPPGLGKSAVVAQLADELYGDQNVYSNLQDMNKYEVNIMRDNYLLDLRPAQRDPVELAGIPGLNAEGRTVHGIPDIYPDDGEGLMFMDEFNASLPLTQAVLYELVHDGRLGGWIKPPKWSIACAGNREEDRAIVTRMSTAMGSRFHHIDFELDVDEWVAWALQNDLDIRVIAFIRMRPDLLHVFDPKKNVRTFPCPRTYDNLSKIMLTNPPDHLDYETAKGEIGDGAGAEFAGFLKVWNRLPDIDGIILDPIGSPVPSINESDILYAVTGALAKKASRDNFAQILQYIERLPSKEFQTLFVRDAKSSKKHGLEIQQTKAYIKWTVENQEIFI